MSRKEISSKEISNYLDSLNSHPVYESIKTLEDLQVFMEHHIYSVWDFMSLIKYLQGIVAPTNHPWTPRGDGDVRRFINELVLEEECDELPGTEHFISHFELYQMAMKEVGASTSGIEKFILALESEKVGDALENEFVPKPSREFSKLNFKFINDFKPHLVASSLALGREHVIPGMFRSILSRINVSEKEAPIFHYYLNRHVHLDEDFHGPLSLRLLNSLCKTNEEVDEAIEVAKKSIESRLKFWDGVLESINKSKPF
jgi:hypothetical protein